MLGETIEQERLDSEEVGQKLTDVVVDGIETTPTHTQWEVKLMRWDKDISKKRRSTGTIHTYRDDLMFPKREIG